MLPVRKEILDMAGYTPGEQPQAGKFIKLNTNENPYPCSAKVKQAIGRVCQQGLSLYPDATASAFRACAGRVLGVDPDWILCGNGSDDILTIATRTFVSPGDLVRFPSPSYILYRTLAEIQGARVEEVRFESDWSLSDLFTADADGLKLVFLPNPNSPSGTMISAEQVLQIAERLPCPILVDEAYVDFAEESCIGLVAQNEKIMVSRSLSKSYSLAGLRFGFLIAQPQIVEQMNKVKDSYNCDALSIAGATAAIDDQAWLAECRAKILATRARLADQMATLGFNPTPSHANFIWNPHPNLPLRPIYERLKESRILVRYMDYPEWGEGLRISVGSDEQIDACLTKLKEMM